MKRAAVLLAGFLCAAAAFSQGGEDALRSLMVDDSPDAGRRLTQLYKDTKDSDQRFWLVQALSHRLQERSDTVALDALILAAGERDPGVSGAALRGLAVFDSLPPAALNHARMEKIEEAAKLGMESSTGSVREAARELDRSVRFFKDPASRDTPPPPDGLQSPRKGMIARGAKLFQWVWIFLFPLVGGFWAWAGAPVFDHDAADGRRAAAAFSILSHQFLFLGMCGFVWVSLASLVGGYGFYAMAEILGDALYPAPGSWLAFYLAAGLSVLLPASLAAGGFSRRPEGSLFVSGLRSLPWAILFSVLAITVFAPLEIFYRLFFKRPRTPAGEEAGGLEAVLDILDAGSFRSALLASAIAAREGRGAWSALLETRKILPAAAPRRDFSLAGFDSRFILLCGTPAMALLCSLVAKGMPVRWSVGWPIIILACGIWAWGVLSAVLFALLQTLSGVDAAYRVVRAEGGELPQAFSVFEVEAKSEIKEENADE